MRTLLNCSHSWKKLEFWEKIKVKMALEMKSSKKRALSKMLRKIFQKYSKKQCQESKKVNQKNMLILILLKNKRNKMYKIKSRMNFLSMMI